MMHLIGNLEASYDWSSARVPETLRALAAQHLPSSRGECELNLDTLDGGKLRPLKGIYPTIEQCGRRGRVLHDASEE